MSWRERIEAQIAELEDCNKTCGVHMGECGTGCNYQYEQDCAAESLKVLLDVAVAADDVAQYCEIDAAGWMDSLIAALDKLRETGDE